MNDFLIVAAIDAAGDLGVKRFSLNFAVFRSALERGERIGAGPVTRLWRGILVFASRWFQIESLYKFNAKFAPVWVPRFFVWPGTRDTPRVALAALEAEAFLVWPKLEVRRLARRLGLGRVRRRLLQSARTGAPGRADQAGLPGPAGRWAGSGRWALLAVGCRFAVCRFAVCRARFAAARRARWAGGCAWWAGGCAWWAGGCAWCARVRRGAGPGQRRRPARQWPRCGRTAERIRSRAQPRRARPGREQFRPGQPG